MARTIKLGGAMDIARAPRFAVLAWIATGLWVAFAVFTYMRLSQVVGFYIPLIIYIVVTTTTLLSRTGGRGKFPCLLLEVQFLLTCVPLAFICVTGAFATYTTYRLGRIPLPHHPGPSVIGIGLFSFGIVWVLSTAGLFLAYLLVRHRFQASGGARWLLFGMSLAIWLLYCGLRTLDPLGFFDWLGD